MMDQLQILSFSGFAKLSMIRRESGDTSLTGLVINNRRAFWSPMPSLLSSLSLVRCGFAIDRLLRDSAPSPLAIGTYYHFLNRTGWLDLLSKVHLV
jgi:hypothetical protein